MAALSLPAHTPKTGGSSYHNTDPAQCASPDTYHTLVEKIHPVDCHLNVDTSEAAKARVQDWAHIWTLQPGKLLYRAQKTADKVSLALQTVNRYGSWFATTKPHSLLHIKDEAPYIAEYRVTADIAVLYHHDLATTGYRYIGFSPLDKKNPHNSAFEKECKKRFPGVTISGYTGCNECEVYLKWDVIKSGLELTGTPKHMKLEDLRLKGEAKKAKKAKKTGKSEGKYMISVSPPKETAKAKKAGEPAQEAIYGDAYFYNDYLYYDYLQQNQPRDNQYVLNGYDYNLAPSTAKSQYSLAVDMEHELLFGIIGVALLLCCILGMLTVIGCGVCGLYHKSKPRKHCYYDETDHV